MRTKCDMTWSVSMTGRVAKRLRQLPEPVQAIVRQLLHEIGAAGPVRTG